MFSIKSLSDHLGMRDISIHFEFFLPVILHMLLASADVSSSFFIYEYYASGHLRISCLFLTFKEGSVDSHKKTMCKTIICIICILVQFHKITTYTFFSFYIL